MSNKPSWIKSKAQVEFEKAINKAQKRQRELKKKLDNTDHKMFSDYEPHKNEDLESIKIQRSEWRAEIREVEDWLTKNKPNEETN